MKKIVFEASKHRLLWLYMADSYVIDHIIEYWDASVDDYKAHLCSLLFGDVPLCGCFACDCAGSLSLFRGDDTCKCEVCPINIGNCIFDGFALYDKYEKALNLYTETGEQSDKDTVQRIALLIANAEPSCNAEYYEWR